MKELTITISDELYNNLLILEEVTQSADKIIIDGIENEVDRYIDPNGKLDPVKAIWEHYPDEVELQALVDEAISQNGNANINEILKGACIKQDCYILCDQRIFTNKNIKIYLPEQRIVKTVPAEEVSKLDYSYDI